MANINLKKKLSILVHVPSCKPNGFWSDTFKKELEKEFNNEYELTLLDGMDDGRVLTCITKLENPDDNGITGFTLNASYIGEEKEKIIERIKKVYDLLKEKHKDGNYEWLNATER